MTNNKKLLEILDRAQGGVSPNKAECKFLLELDENSLDAYLLRAVANNIIRHGNDNSAIILGQIGIDISGCSGNCKFCTFGKEHTELTPHRMGTDELTAKIKSFCDAGDLYGLYLMTMHDYDLDFLLDAIRLARKTAPETTQIWVNMGDSDRDTMMEIKKSGVTGIYHVCRIGEGEDTDLDPKNRIKTMENALSAGLELYTCCEPIGPEHTPEQLIENMFIGIDLGCTQHAAMRRVAVPGSPLAGRGQISETRLAQIVAVIALASFTTETMEYMGVHEPNKLGYTSGANIITAESGANPRDSKAETSENRGFDMNACRKMLYECGFTHLRRGDESKIPLNFDYCNQF